MASSKEYLDFVLEQLSGVEDISFRAMMGEYIIYCRGKVIGGVYDDRFLLKPTESAKRLMPDGIFELPYPGGKEMILADVDNRALLDELIPAIANDLHQGCASHGVPPINRTSRSNDARSQRADSEKAKKTKKSGKKRFFLQNCVFFI